VCKTAILRVHVHQQTPLGKGSSTSPTTIKQSSSSVVNGVAATCVRALLFQGHPVDSGQWLSSHSTLSIMPLCCQQSAWLQEGSCETDAICGDESQGVWCRRDYYEGFRYDYFIICHSFGHFQCCAAVLKCIAFSAAKTFNVQFLRTVCLLPLQHR